MPRSLRPTQAGWFFFAITLGVAFAALNTGNNLLYLVLSLLLAFLVLSGVLSESALGGIRVRRRLPRELFAEASNAVLLEIENTHRRVPAFAILVEDRRFVPEDSEAEADTRFVEPAGRVFALRIGPGETEARRYALLPERRGPLELAHFAVSTRFPFGLFLKSRIIDAPERTLVFPAIDPMPVPDPAPATHDEGAQPIVTSGTGVDVAGLREYVPGDSLRRVHWRPSVRRGELLVKQVEDPVQAAIEVILQTGDERSPFGLEKRIRRAASEVVAALDAGLRVGLRANDEPFAADHGPFHRRRLLSHLAEIAPLERVSRDGAQT